MGRFAAARHGVLSRDRALALGATGEMIRGRLESGRWRRLHPGIYGLNGAPDTWRQRLLAVCLSAREGAVASHRAAARLWQLPGGDEMLEVTVPRGRRFRRPGVIAHESSLLPAVDTALLDAIPVTTPARTLIDLAAVLPPERVEEAIDAALSSGLVRRPRLLWRLGELATGGRPGVEVVRSILEARGPLVRRSSAPTSGLPSARRTLPGRTSRLRASAPSGEYKPRALGRLAPFGPHCAWPYLRLAVEADGPQRGPRETASDVAERTDK